MAHSAVAAGGAEMLKEQHDADRAVCEVYQVLRRPQLRLRLGSDIARLSGLWSPLDIAESGSIGVSH